MITADDVLSKHVTLLMHKINLFDLWGDDQ